MLNQVVLVGRLVKTPELRVTDNGKKTSTITLAVPRNYKNINGEYDTDFLDCTLWTNIAENTSEYCQTGDMVGVKGRIQTRVIQNEDGSKKKKTEILQMLMLNPKLAILDETDSGLDVDAIRTVSKGIEMFKTDENAVLIITHNTKILHSLKPDYVHVLVDGKIVKTGDASLAKEIEENGYEKYKNI